jgi:hypothetical protein
MSQISIPANYLLSRQLDRQNENLGVPRDVQDMAVRPDAEPALFDAYGVMNSLRQY